MPLSAVVLVMILDQASKWLMLTHILNPPEIIPITSFLNLRLGFNPGVSFGFLGGGMAGPWLLSGLAMAIVAGLSVWAARTDSRTEAVAIGAIIGGAIGNVIDRVRQGAVTDFLDLHAFGWHWPTFNMADIGITGGVGLLLLHGVRQGRRAAAIDQDQREARIDG
ncbi:signal peptidase II [Azospirillum sp. B21]|uniref:signal peptidase II n=1 Tax=Azospirillum sp. B21 TaxID=2607496 RepID=UPI0011EDABA8|nr:signal peptidase II [Azospirillum sp. B21]KAA0577775.1 signal peptidase II [Azospirillum sp. B21]